MLNSSISRLSQIMTAVEESIERSGRPQVPAWLPGPDWAISVACDCRSRERAWQLVHDVYCDKGYQANRARGVRLLLQDALPESTTFLAERRPAAAAPLATLTLIPDSPLGLPMDDNCRAELDSMRAAGRRLCEVAKLAVSDTAEASGASSSGALLHLFRLAHLKASRLEHATDLVASVVPRHARFYRKVLLFEPIGEARSYGSVCGTTGVPLRLDLTTAEARYRERYDGRPGSHNLYRMFINNEEPAPLAWLRASQTRMSESEFRHFMVERSDLLERAGAGNRMYLQSRYLSYDFDRIFLEAGLVNLTLAGEGIA